MDLLSAESATRLLVDARGLSHGQCRTLLKAGLAGDAIELPGVHLYSESRVRSLASRRAVDLDEVSKQTALAGERILVMRIGESAEDASGRMIGWNPEEKDWDEHRRAIACWWRIGSPAQSEIEERASRSAQAVLATVGGLVVFGANCRGLARQQDGTKEVDGEGRVALALERPSGDWFRFFDLRFLRLKPGAPWAWCQVPRLD